MTLLIKSGRDVLSSTISGLRQGAPMGVLSFITSLMLVKLFPQYLEMKKTYLQGKNTLRYRLSEMTGRDLYSDSELLRESIKLMVLAIPLFEEILCRLTIQQVLMKNCVEKIAEIYTGKSGFLSSPRATAIRILATSIIFGALHYINPNRDASNEKYFRSQVIFGTVMGINFGFTKEKFGLAAAVGAHMMNNFLSTVPVILLDKTPADI